MTAAEDLTRALLGMAERGARPRCGDGDTSYAWTSDDPEARALAVTWCQSCPLTALCWDAAAEGHVTWGVWAGRDCAEPPVQRQLRARRQQLKETA